jgi:hypothetical protein
MTIQEMHIAVNIGLQRIASYVFDDFLTEEVDYYLNRAINGYVRIQKTALDTDPSAQENLHTVMDTWGFSGADLMTSADLPDAIGADLGVIDSDREFQHHVSTRVKFASGRWKNTRLVPQELFFEYLQTKNNTPVFRELPACLISNRLYVLPDATDSAVSLLTLLYIKKPDVVNFDADVSCNLPEHVHDDIVQFAVGLMVADLSKKIEAQG